MSDAHVDPIAFAPILQERVWGGRALGERFGRHLPTDAPYGESWELVDREAEQSVVLGGPDDGRTLNELWRDARAAIFGPRAVEAGDRFPLLVKLLDARDTLSVQVHPPAELAPELGGEPKTEMWVLAGATPDAHLYAGLRAGVTREDFAGALERKEDVSALLHRTPVAEGDALFLPSGRVHAIGAGCLIVEIQQSSDTTYRVYDFDRPGLDGKPRQLHVEQSLRSIDFDDPEPPLLDARGPGEVVACPYFVVSRERATTEAPIRPGTAGECAVVVPLDGAVTSGGRTFAAGQTFLVPAVSAATLAPEGDAPVDVLVTELPPV